MRYLLGKPIAERILNEASRQSRALHARGITPSIAVILVGNDAASELYVAAKQKIARKIGVDFVLYRLPSDIDQDSLSRLLITLSDDDSIHGIVIQLPLPETLNLSRLIKFIDPLKDVDRFRDDSEHDAPTPQAVAMLMAEYGIECRNKKIGIIGKGFLVGQPLEKLLSEYGGKVTVFDINTQQIAQKAQTQEILITATGQPRLVTKAFANSNQYIIDVGSARDTETNQIVGDVDHTELDEYVAGITPLVGGVGPITVALLMQNVIRAAQKLKFDN